MGSVAGSLSKTRGYYQVRIDGSLCQLHRIIYAMYHDGFTDNQIDHQNKNRGNNSISNLRPVTHQENQKNRSKNSNNSSGVTGIYWHNNRQKWEVKINVNGKRKHLGYFQTFYVAVYCRHAAEIKYGYTND